MTLLAIVLLACSPDDKSPADTDTDAGSDADADSDADSDADPDADADSDADADADADTLPDCGPFSGVGAPGRSWSFQMLYASMYTSNYTLTIASVDATSGAVELTYAAVTDYVDPAYDRYDYVVDGTVSWQCDALGLQTAGWNYHFVNADGSEGSDLTEYDPPYLVIPYDPTASASFAIAGTRNGVPFETTGTSTCQGEATGPTAAGDSRVLGLMATSGSRTLYRQVAEGKGLVWEQDATSSPFPTYELTSFTP